METSGEGRGPSESVETERKFRVHGLFKLPTLSSETWSLDEPVTSVLSASYLDTDDLRLARWKVSLRRREGGSDEGWHLKLPVEGETREELTLALTDGTLDEPPAALTDLVLSLTRAAPLTVAATLRTERTTYGVRDPEGALLAELTDDSVSVLDGGRTVARFRELEVELVDGGAEVLDSLEGELTSAGAVRGGTLSKVARALGPQAAASPDVPKPAPVRPPDPAGLAVQAYLARNTRALLAHDRGVRRDAPDSVHQMRVAARRLRSGLKVFGPLVEAEPARRLRDELAWLAGSLGEVRDREVLRDRLLADMDRLASDVDLDLDTAAARTLIRSAFGKDLAAARRRVLDTLRSARYLNLLDELVHVCSRPPLTTAADQSCAEVLPPLVRRAWRRLERDVKKLSVDGPDSEWHEARIAAKGSRYACEAVEPIFGKPARRMARLVEQVTEILGEHQDAALAADAVRALAGRQRLSGSTGFALGLVHGIERDAVSETRRQLVEAWPEVSRSRHRQWLDPRSAK